MVDQAIDEQIDNIVEEEVKDNEPEVEEEDSSDENEESDEQSNEEPEDELSIYGFNDKQKEYFASIKQEQEKLAKQVEEQQKFIDRQGTEIGNLRKSDHKLKELENEISSKRKLQENLADDFNSNRPDYDATSAEIAKLEIEKGKVLREVNKHQITRVIPNYDDLKKSEIVEVLKQDGALDYEIPTFLEQLEDNPSIAIQIAHRASNIRKIKEYDAKIAELTGGKKKVIEKISNVAGVKTITSSNSANNGTLNKEVHLMSDEELNRSYEEQIRKLRK